MPEVEVIDTIAARKVQKADREKLRRDRLNEHFLDLGNALGKAWLPLNIILFGKHACSIFKYIFFVCSLSFIIFFFFFFFTINCLVLFSYGRLKYLTNPSKGNGFGN